MNSKPSKGSVFMPLDMYDDRYNDYFVVCEQTTPDNSKIEILDDGKKNGLNYLRFSACLQAFYGLNRNRRLWKADQIKTMSEDKPVQELLKRGSFAGEAGHPVPMDGKVTIERILTIDPLRTSHRIISLNWPNPNELHGVVETLDDQNGPGNKMMRSIMQGIEPAFSLRSLVPQRKNADGTTLVIGPGRLVAYDWVFLPSHTEAYMDNEIPVKEIVSKPQFQTVMEGYCDFVLENSDKVRRVIEDYDVAMESATLDPKTNTLSIGSKEGRIIVAPETKYRREFRDLLNLF